MSDTTHRVNHHPGLLKTLTGKGFFRVQLLWFVAVSLIPLAVASYINYQTIHNTLQKEIITQLRNTAFHKTNEIEHFFSESMKSLNWEARRETVKKQLQELTKAFENAGLPLHEFIYSRQWTEIAQKGADQFDFFVTINEFYDVFLIDYKGNILYTATEESDLGTNIFTGQYAHSHFGEACRTAFSENRTVFSDFERYEPSGHTDASFLVTPVYDLQGKPGGLMAIQLSSAKIDRIMQSTDLTGGVNSFLVGHDLLLRSHTNEAHLLSPLEIKIDTKKTRSWQQHILSGKPDDTQLGPTDIYTNHNDIKVLGLFSYLDITGVPLAVITEIPVATAFRDVTQVAGISLVMFFVVAVIVLIMAFWAAKQVTRPLHNLARQAELVAMGDLSVKLDHDVTANNEFGLLNRNFKKITTSLQDIASVCEDITLGIFDRTVKVRSHKDTLAIAVNKMIKSFRDVIDQANSISTGDFSVTIVPRSEQDTLSHALQKMATSLDEQDWIKSGLAELSNRLQGVQDLATLGKSVLNFVGDYLHIQVGAFFVLNGGKLQLEAGYAIKKENNYHPEFSLGDGLVGQSALEKRTIVFNNVPADHINISINSGIGVSPPSTIVVLPLCLEGVAKGVMEFGASTEFTPLEISFLEMITSSIAINIHTAQARIEMQMLLEETQRQSEELQSQQEELRVANEELEEQSEELRAANEELEEKTEYLEIQQEEILKARANLEMKAGELAQASKYKSEFLANMSHELRSPLNSLLILAKSLSDNEEENLTESQLEAARIIYSSGKDQLNLINDILDISKVEAGRLEIHRENMRLSFLQNDIEERFSRQANDKGLSFTTNFSPALPESLFTDEQRLKQILNNLLGNAIKFTSQGSVRLDVIPAAADTTLRNKSLKSADGIISFAVTDTGIGIPEDKQESIFEAFRQGDGSTSRSYGGTGLGLTISRQLAGLLGGEIQLESKPGQGCTFTVYLPAQGIQGNLVKNEQLPQPPDDNNIKETQQDSPEPTASTQAVEKSEQVTFIADDRHTIQNGEKSLLIIEDDPIFAEIIAHMARGKGYKILAASNGRSGILLATEYQPKAIILDLGLPDLGGASVLKNLKSNLETRHIPVHIVSATKKSSLPPLKGAIGFLAKPATKKNMDKVFAQFDEIIQGGVKKLLIVDDDKVSRDNIKKLLDNQGMEIITAETGEKAYSLLTSESFDCIVLDLTLPDMSGFDLLAKLDLEENSASVPVIVYTGRDLTEEEHETLQQYARTVVIKGAESNERLLDEVSLFIHSMTSNLPPEQREMIQMIHDSDEILKDKKILLVDDDMRNTFALSGLLQKLGMVVTMAANGQQALDKLDDDEFDMVLMDIMMPVMDGYEAIRKIKAQKRFRNLPVIALTAKAMPEDRQICLDAGANDYLAKPIDQERLLSLMRVWLFK